MDQVYLDYLKIVHGSYNIVLALLFSCQGSLGWKIRQERKAGGARDSTIVKRHRRRGIFLAPLGMLGYFAGLIIISLDKGRVLVYPLHLVTGSVLVLCIAAAYTISRRIIGPAPHWRTLHFSIGLMILTLYLLQIEFGLDILF